MDEQADIYSAINVFLTRNPSIQDLVNFCEAQVNFRPQCRQFIQNWFLDQVVKPQYAGNLFEDIVLVRQHSFALEPKNLAAKHLLRNEVKTTPA